VAYGVEVLAWACSVGLRQGSYTYGLGHVAFMRNGVEFRESLYAVLCGRIDRKMFKVTRPVVGPIAMLVVFGSLTVISAPERKSKFADVLISHASSAQIPAAGAAVFDWLIGDWDDVYDYGRGGSRCVSIGEWHRSWVLEGRAVRIYGSFRSDPNGMQLHPAITIGMAQPIRIYDP